MNRTVIVPYKTHPEAAGRNQQLVENMYSELAARNPAGLR